MVTSTVVVSGVIIAEQASLFVELMSECVVALGARVKLREAINELHGVVKAGANNKSLVGEHFTIVKGELVGVRVQFSDGSELNL